MIPIEVRSQMNALESEIQEFAERRINFALDHLRRIRHISISLKDVNGPKGGIDKHCRIIAKIGAASMVLDETQPDWQSAVARAIHRLDRNASQQSQRISKSKHPKPQWDRLRTANRQAGSQATRASKTAFQVHRGS